MAKVGNYTSTPRLGSYLVVLEQQKRYSKTPPSFALQLHRVGNSMEFWSWGVWLENWMELPEFNSRAMPNTPLAEEVQNRCLSITNHVYFVSH
jgi:hypothetical protein